ncbi:DUF4365 domain-containing protein [Cellulosimicrobium sp. TH-20]|uniref:DUF4365 domain-containing protein n=1 Tax=Cellulosimicrobium sp. TH-20 TaxID=1980001 RepID=UPI0018DEBA2E|nr:DUF4365 domain-containing protein [Cellulosimicrobium sp. TH-20]
MAVDVLKTPMVVPEAVRVARESSMAAVTPLWDRVATSTDDRGGRSRMPSSSDPAPSEEAWVAGANLHLNARKARYGVAYLRAIASQAGWSLQETSPDEDTEAVDATLGFVEGSVLVQVKCGTRELRNGHVRVPVTDEWVRKWSNKLLPAYLVYVRVPSDPRSWCTPGDRFTSHAALGYWAPVNNVALGPSVEVSTRLTAETLPQWRSDFLGRFQGGSAA